MIQWYMKYWFYVSHIPDQIRIWKCCFLRRQEKNKDKPQRPLSWVSESFRQDIGQFHSFIHEAFNQSADYFIKVPFPYCSGYEQERIRFQRGKAFFTIKNVLFYYQKRWKRVWIHACHCTT